MASTSFLQHYLEYITSPAILLTALLIFVPLSIELFRRKSELGDGPITAAIPGCFRFGIYNRTNLSNQPERNTGRRNTLGQDSMTGSTHIKALFTYPIKSCRGVELSASEVIATGLMYDRLFTFGQLVSTEDKSKKSDNIVEDVNASWKHEWRFMTQREFPRLALLKTELWVPKPQTTEMGGNNADVNGRGRNRAEGRNAEAFQDDASQVYDERNTDWAAEGGCLIVTFPFEPDFNPFELRTQTITLRIPLVPTASRAASKKYTSEPLIIWKDCPTSINLTPEIPAHHLEQLRYFLGASNPIALFRVDDSHHRAVTRNLPTDRPTSEKYSIGFADAFSVNILNLASVRAVDDAQPATARYKGDLDPRRFRANVYVSGPPAYAEDTWKKINMGRSVAARASVRRDLSPASRRDADARDPQRLVETDGEYHVACRTARCKLPNVHPDTGKKDVNEPYTTLGRTRKVDKGAYPHPCLGVHVIPLFERGVLRVGGEVEVLERGEHVYEKMFK